MGPIWAAARERDTCWQASRRDDNNGVTELVRWVSDAGGVLTPDEDCVLWKWGPLYNPLYAGHAVESGKKGTTAERLSYPVLVARGGTRPLPRVGQAANGGCLYTAISARVPLPMGGAATASPGLQVFNGDQLAATALALRYLTYVWPGELITLIWGKNVVGYPIPGLPEDMLPTTTGSVDDILPFSTPSHRRTSG